MTLPAGIMSKRIRQRGSWAAADWAPGPSHPAARDFAFLASYWLAGDAISTHRATTTVFERKLDRLLFRDFEIGCVRFTPNFQIPLP